jgi:hypothetical protein
MTFTAPKRYSYLITGLERPLGLQEVETPRISIKSSQEGDKVVSPLQWPPLIPKRYPWY